jgi:putative Mg2+ transporter-C (MgtC) family protein
VDTFDEGRIELELTLAARMALAALLGFVVGLERESRGKSAGERTFAIVGLGAAGFAGVAISMFPDTAGQAVAGVATGIGFLGVGIIWRAEEGQTRGLTTAASILSVAAIGVVTGMGLSLTAILGTGLALAILEFDRLPGLHGLHRRVTGRPDMDDEDQSERFASSRARSNTSSSMASVSFPVNVFC